MSTRLHGLAMRYDRNAQVFGLVNGGATYWGGCSEEANLDGKKLLGNREFRLWYVKCKLPARRISRVEGTILQAKWKLRLEVLLGSSHIRNRIQIYKTGCYQLEVSKVRENQSIRKKTPTKLEQSIIEMPWRGGRSNKGDGKDSNGIGKNPTACEVL